MEGLKENLWDIQDLNVVDVNVISFGGEDSAACSPSSKSLSIVTTSLSDAHQVVPNSH
jgi:hypothetical protein